MQGAPEEEKGTDGLPVPPYSIYNIGNSKPENRMEFVRILLKEVVRSGVLLPDFDIGKYIELVPMQPGDVPVTYVDTNRLEQDYEFRPKTDLRTGLRSFAEWYREYHRI